MNGIYIEAMMIFTNRFSLAGRATDRKIISAGIDTDIIPANRNPGVISNIKTRPV
ncbi:MAG TPA: hypothetical protein PL108_08045 [Sediminibacterium sp.]|jgi:hypothetical protein|nr:hypothetical protein [Sediminibacterium sp.]